MSESPAGRRGHSLTRRVVLTVVLALVAVWSVLTALELARTRFLEPDNPAITAAVQSVSDELTGVEDPGLARLIVEAIDRAGTAARRRENLAIPIFLRVRDRDLNRVIFNSPAGLRLDRLPIGHSSRIIGGSNYYILVAENGRWEIAVGQATLPTIWLLREITKDMAMDILVAFPIVLIPVWLSVLFGLRPLRELARSVSRRDADDLTPIGISGRHTELILLAEAFNQQLVRVGRRIARERAFVQDAAHELRTPMAVIAVNAHAVANARTADERREAESLLNAGLLRTSHLIQQLLALARLDVNRRVELLMQDVVALIREDLAAADALAEAKRIELSFDAPEVMEKRVDPHALHSIVGNLVDNAIRYGRDGGRVAVSVANTQEGWQLTVADDGVGLPPSERERVFERFYRGIHDDVPGTGLGLAIVRAAATRLGGSVRIEEGLGGAGCSFVVRFDG